MSTRVICDRCGETLCLTGNGYYRSETVHVTSLVQNAKIISCDLCPRCLDELRAWMDERKGGGAR